jgi:hypothetical protein
MYLGQIIFLLGVPRKDLTAQPLTYSRELSPACQFPITPKLSDLVDMTVASISNGAKLVLIEGFSWPSLLASNEPNLDDQITACTYPHISSLASMVA